MNTFQNKQEDIELINRIKNGDDSAFEILLKKYQKTIHFTVTNIVKDEIVAEDIVMETFLRVFKNINNYNQKFSFTTWIFSIATNLAIDHTRKKKHIRFKSSDEEDGSFGVFLDSIASKTAESPDKKLIDSNRAAFVKTLLGKLKPDYRIVMELRYFEDMSYKEIAEELGESISFVKTKLHRAKKQLKKILKNFDEQI